MLEGPARRLHRIAALRLSGLAAYGPAGCGAALLLPPTAPDGGLGDFGWDGVPGLGARVEPFCCGGDLGAAVCSDWARFGLSGEGCLQEGPLGGPIAWDPTGIYGAIRLLDSFVEVSGL
ncbi:hypothetical protein NDU88_005996 [Pleurodeles waltl]|uniref:Uncharacterized protein n=1 Tax=Pleurodeles waltl TaxID=8319 RepID=A0AAV7PKH5_PLEWA|nr:hypothetical protein NDU88_005996 [Pleurodeles waltl]